MKTYAGGRSLDGAVVTVDGVLLDPRYDIKRFSRMGFEWTYEGDGPRQLALALLQGVAGTSRVVTCNAAAGSEKFWEALGFAPDRRDGRTHILQMHPLG